MDQTIATELAFESEEISKVVEREGAEVISFVLQPSYRAIINIRGPKFEKKKKIKKTIEQSQS